LATYGDDLAAITFGGGWGFAKDRFSNTPVWMLGGELKIADGFKLITEHWIPTRTNEKLSSIGIRIYGHNFAADIGFVHPSDSDPVGFSNIPWLGFAYNF
jgi:hypothetical protein